jgi:hypothetical protein
MTGACRVRQTWFCQNIQRSYSFMVVSGMAMIAHGSSGLKHDLNFGRQKFKATGQETSCINSA